MPLCLPEGAGVGTRLALDWGASGWREGLCVDVSTELSRDSRLETFRVAYDDDGRGARSAWHGRHGDPVREVRVVTASESTADVVASDWEPLPLRCQITHARLSEPAKGSQCVHVAKCNLAALRLYAGRTCPCCSAVIARSRDVALDEHLKSQLEQVPAPRSLRALPTRPHPRVPPYPTPARRGPLGRPSAIPD